MGNKTPALKGAVNGGSGAVGAISSDADLTSSFVVCFAALPTASRKGSCF